MTHVPGNFLIVDDHETNRLKLAMAVRALGHRSKEAENGRVALEMLRADDFDLVLLDIVMPEMSGHEVLREISADPKLRSVPVIVISGNNQVADAIKCIEAGADDYLSKPFDATLLRARISSSLTKKRLNDALHHRMQFIRDILGKFIPNAVANEIVESGGDLQPVRTEATVLMTDVAGFTQMVERAPPEQVFEMLNEYFHAILQPITQFGGIVNNFEGDALMALFNVPLPDPEHSENAVRAALEINRITGSRTFAGVQMCTRIGIDTGSVIAGNIGDGTRLTYTVVGKTVNIAARLEQLNKELGSHVILTDRTAAALKGSYPLEDAGHVTLRGLIEPIGIKILKT
jgi:class 3 adenylate cyclase